MIRECCNCGAEQEEKWMMHYDIGTKTMWLCWDCYKQGQRENHLNDLRRQKRLNKMQKKKGQE